MMRTANDSHMKRTRNIARPRRKEGQRDIARTRERESQWVRGSRWQYGRIPVRSHVTWMSWRKCGKEWPQGIVVTQTGFRNVWLRVTFEGKATVAWCLLNISTMGILRC